MPHHRALVVLGPPGSGKGTLCKMIGAAPGFVHLGAGDMFRTLAAERKLPEDVSDAIARGELVSDEQVMEQLRRYVAETLPKRGYRAGEQTLLLDGIPRTVAQAMAIEQEADVLLVVHLAAHDEEVLVQRLSARAKKENRADDAHEETIRHRFEVYHAETEPVLAFYGPNRIATVDAIGTPLEVLRRLLDVLIPLSLG